MRNLGQLSCHIRVKSASVKHPRGTTPRHRTAFQCLVIPRPWRHMSRWWGLVTPHPSLQSRDDEHPALFCPRSCADAKTVVKLRVLRKSCERNCVTGRRDGIQMAFCKHTFTEAEEARSGTHRAMLPCINWICQCTDFSPNIIYVTLYVLCLVSEQQNPANFS